MISFLLTGYILSVVVKSQLHECVYKGGPNQNYTLNLTIMSDWTLSLENPDFNYYYTPCGNREICSQGNQNTASNVVQYSPSSNQCNYYLSIDHQDQPQYSLHSAAWYFAYSDGQLCQQTNTPRRTTVYFNCDPNVPGAGWLYAAEEFQHCHYALQIRSPLACVPENQLNAQCQWKYTDIQTNITYNLDLSGLSGEIIYSSETNNNNQTGYIHYFSPCGNNLRCYAQPVITPNAMAMIENSKTGTCDQYLAQWDSGRVQPFYYNDTKHWTFHYFNGEKCTNGYISQETIRIYCDKSVDKYKVLNATYDGDCFWEFNIASKLACQSQK